MKINFSDPSGGAVDIDILSLQGVSLLSVRSQPLESGLLEYSTDVLAPGIYFVRIRQQDKIALKKVVK